MRRSSWVKGMLAALSVGFASLALADVEVAMVTSLQGKVSRIAPLGPQPMEVFTKLKHGDLLALDKGAMLQIVYFDNGREETWRGRGRLEVAHSDSTPKGLPPPQVRTLPPVMVKQIAKTPVLESQGRAGMMRLRGVASAEDIATVETTYQRLRVERSGRDIKPELYLLSAMFELREFDRVEAALADLQRDQAGNPDVAVVAVIYGKALKNAREAK
jgi:hypothetical protein